MRDLLLEMYVRFFQGKRSSRDFLVLSSSPFLCLNPNMFLGASISTSRRIWSLEGSPLSQKVSQPLLFPNKRFLLFAASASPLSFELLLSHDVSVDQDCFP